MDDIQMIEQRFGILDQVPIGICVLRDDFVVIFWNRCLEEWTRVKKSQILGQNISDYFPDLNQPKYHERLKQIFAGGPPTIFSSQLHQYIIPCPLANNSWRIQQTTVIAVPATPWESEEAHWQELNQQNYPHSSYPYPSSLLSYQGSKYKPILPLQTALEPQALTSLTPEEIAKLFLQKQSFEPKQAIANCSPFHALLVIQDVTELTNRIHDYRKMRDQALEEIKERQRVEEALRQSEQRYRQIVETIVEGIWVIDAYGQTTFVNQQMANMLGYTVEEILSQPLLTFVAPESQLSLVIDSKDQQNCHCLIADLKEQHDLKFRRKDGSDLWTIVSTSSIFDSSGEYIGILGTITDITDRKLAEQALQQQAERERLMGVITQQIRQSLNLNEILNTTVTQVREFLQTDRVIIYRFNPDWTGVVMVESVANNWQPILGLTIEDTCFQTNYVHSYRQGRIRSIENIYQANLSQCHIDLLEQFQVKSNLVVPIVQGSLELVVGDQQSNYPIDHRLWGLLIAHNCSASRKWHSWETDLLQQLATQVAIAIQQAELYQKLKAANEELKKLAISDGLTRLANRRQFDEYLNQEWRRLAREEAFLSLILCDVDFFKSYNDTYGHLAGDFCLQEVAEALRRAIKRPADLAARYGGEEFAIILPYTQTPGAANVAQEILIKIRELNIPHRNSQVSDYVTLSLGIATIIPSPQSSPAILIAAADQALYQAKSEGRNCIKIYQSEENEIRGYFK